VIVADPIDVLSEVRDRLVNLPDQVAEMVRFEMAAPAHSAEDVLPDLTARAAAAPFEDLIPQLMGEQAGSPQGAVAASPEMAETPTAEMPASEEFESPTAEPSAAEYPQVEGGAASPSADYEIPAAGDQGDQGQVLSMLQEISAAVQGGGQQAGPAFRSPPPVQRIPWAGSAPTTGEGFSGGASPSMDVSNIAATGGASSRLGYGSHSKNTRYLHPDTDVGGAPR
jgi:hypothetical protein